MFSILGVGSAKESHFFFLSPKTTSILMWFLLILKKEATKLEKRELFHDASTDSLIIKREKTRKVHTDLINRIIMFVTAYV